MLGVLGQDVAERFRRISVKTSRMPGGEFGCVFPPEYMCHRDFLGSSQQNQWGWSALLLPFLDEAALHGTADRSAFVRDDTGDTGPDVESNQDITSSHSVADILDGTSNTIAVGERSWKWHYQMCRSATVSEPFGGTTWAGVAHCANQEHVTSVTSLPLNFLFADGAVRFISDGVDNKKSTPYGVL